MDGLVRTGVPAWRRTIMAGKSGQPQGAKSGERIAKVMARAGLCSRREAEAWIAAGRVAVNGKPIASPALDVATRDHVTVDGEPLRQRERTRLFLFHKPRGQLTSHADARGRPTIFAALPKGLPRLISVGRLDLNTEGLLLLTNDGGLARTLELPATGWLRRYRVRAHGRVRQEELDRLHNGITIAGIRYGSIEARLEREQGANSWLAFAIREGKNREVKNVLGHLGLAVNRLIRVSFGPFQLGGLPEGAVEEVKTRILRDQLGDRITALSGADFSAPIISVPIDAQEPPARHPPEGAPGSAARSSAKPSARAPGVRAPAPAPLKRKPNRDKKRSRDAERLGGPELARRDKRRGRGPGAGKPRGR
jgi:23S rRNA pseudouridine2605 synthase